jgi:large subunit ribosomal protein L31
MKTGVHPDYHKVLFIDSSNGQEWVSYSTLRSSETREIEGEEVPIVKLDISSHSHPFWTGQARSVDTEGRIDRFKRRYAGRNKKTSAPPPEGAK